MIRAARIAAIGIVMASALVACSTPRYAVEIDLPQGIAPTQVGWVDLYVVASCTNINVGVDPIVAGIPIMESQRLITGSMQASMPLGIFHVPSVALYARAASSDGCTTVAAACQSFTLDQARTLILMLGPIGQPWCGQGQTCNQGNCIAGTTDGGQDAADGQSDAAPESCVPSCTNRFCGSNGCGGSCGNCSSPLVCENTTGSCVSCGGSGMLCCASGTCDGMPDSGLACDGTYCVMCGLSGGPCCSGAVCDRVSLVCVPDANVCRPCGGWGQVCCAGGTCRLRNCDGGTSVMQLCNDAGRCSGTCP